MDLITVLLNLNIPQLMLVLALLTLLVYAPLVYLAVLREEPNRRLIRLLRVWRSGPAKERRRPKRRKR